VDWPPELMALLAGESAREPPAEVRLLADAACREAGPGTVAVLFYGSALRDREVGDRLVDLYIILDGYDGLPGSSVFRHLIRWLPPNVHYIEATDGALTARAKYAVVSLDHLERQVARTTSNPYFWARFAQPTGIVWSRDETSRRRLLAVFAQASDTLLAATRPLVTAPSSSETLWERAFHETYRTELRSEPPGRSHTVYLAAAERYDAIAQALAGRSPEPVDPNGAARRWARRRRIGKALSVMRLAKAAFTFRGGADYIAWKIGRHSGVHVQLTDWHRRHPLLAGVALFWRLYRQRAFR
jgi:hypothetical protein